jgi:hypothetical protein
MHRCRAFPLLRILATGSLAFLLSAGSCAQTDIGAPCDVPLSAPDTNLPGCTADAKPSEEPQCFHPDLSSRDKDFVAFGATDCDNLVCVRSRCSLPADAPDREAACAKALPTASPTGICSAECITNDDCRTGEGLTGTYACRSLVLDQKFLEDLRQNLSPQEYEKYFGRIQSAKYCARAK